LKISDLAVRFDLGFETKNRIEICPSLLLNIILLGLLPVNNRLTGDKPVIHKLLINLLTYY